MDINKLEDRPFTPARVTAGKSAELVSAQTGLIKRLESIKLQPDDPQLYHYYSEIGDISRFSQLTCFLESGGAAFNEDAAKSKALGEAVERYCGAFYWQDRLIRSTYRDLKEAAVAPEKFNLFSEKQHGKDSFAYSRFDKETLTNWAAGFSLVKPQKILVPANFVYVPYQFPTHEEHIASPISTGLACGNSRTEALLSGLSEVVERDAFIITWLNRLPMPKVQIDRGEFPLLDSYLETFTKANTAVHIFDITLDTQIPVYLIILTGRLRGDDVPAAVVATKAGLHREYTITGCLEEAAHTRIWARMLMRQHLKPGQLQESVSDEYANILDNRGHVLYYAHPDALKNLDFLLKNENSLELQKEAAVENQGPLEQLKECTTRLSGKGFDVIGVDVTTPDIEELGLYVERVVIPGLHPLYLGYANRCLGGERLYRIPYEMGFTQAPTKEADINPHPHPFP